MGVLLAAVTGGRSHERKLVTNPSASPTRPGPVQIHPLFLRHISPDPFRRVLVTNRHPRATRRPHQPARPDDPGLKLLREAADAMNLSARGYHRVLRVARTLADLDGRERVARINIAEALSYRQKLAVFQIAA